MCRNPLSKMWIPGEGQKTARKKWLCFGGTKGGREGWYWEGAEDFQGTKNE